MFDEEAKAIQETAKATGKGLDIVKAMGSVLEPFGGMLRDWGNSLRYANLCRLADKTKFLIDSRIAEGKALPIPDGFVLPLLDAASLECEDEVLDLWAALIANAADPEKRFALKKVYIDVLRSLQAVDVLVLKVLTSDPLPAPEEFKDATYVNAEKLAELSGVALEDVTISLQTLARFALIIDSQPQSFYSLDFTHSGFHVNNPSSNFRLSDLGRRLLIATA